jgi:hypothetical protein
MSRTFYSLVALVAVAGLVSFGGGAKASTILFKDTFDNQQTAAFYGAAGGYGVNQEIANSYRQTGTYAGTAYSLIGTTANQVNKTDTTPSGAGMFYSLGGGISPQHNFNGADAAGGLAYSMDIMQAYPGSGPWVMFGFGYDSHSSRPDTNGLLVFFSGSAKLYNHNVEAPSFTWTTNPGTNTTIHNITLVFSDPSTPDNKPFNGTGTLRMEVYADGGTTPVYTYNWASDPANNYIHVWTDGGYGTYWHLLDNLTVTNLTVPEPSTLAMLAVGLVGLLAYAWRKRK